MVVHSAVSAFENVAINVAPGAKSVRPDVAVELYTTKLMTTDYGPAAVDLVKKKPDAIIFILGQAEIVAAAKELRQQGDPGTLYAYAPAVANSTLELGGAAMDGLKSASFTVPVTSDTPAVKEYRDALAKYVPSEKPDYFSLISFALTKITVEAIRRIDGPVNRQSLVNALLEKAMSRPASRDAQVLISSRRAIASASTIEQLRQAQAVVLPLSHGLSLAHTALGLQAIPVRDRSLLRPLFMVKRRGQTLSVAARSLLKMIAANPPEHVLPALTGKKPAKPSNGSRASAPFVSKNSTNVPKV